MVYKMRVTLAGIKGFYRVYMANTGCSLYNFHKQLQTDLEFTVDQPILFKALDADGKVAGRYALVDLGCGTVDSVTLAQAVAAGAAGFTYFYDVVSKKSVDIVIEACEEGNVQAPVIIDTKGPNPIEFENGYVAFEDLPVEKRHLPGEKPAGLSVELDKDEDFDDDTDDDDEEDEEDSDEDKEEIIYDGTEQF